ncbi:hypothetical protein I7969_004245 [Salmonella enterica]|nr:hypothetical protein [Salmonella enterica]
MASRSGAIALQSHTGLWAGTRQKFAATNLFPEEVGLTDMEQQHKYRLKADVYRLI